MKRFWLILLTLGLIAAFSTQVMAVDVKFSGSYYAAGLYQDNITVVKSTSGTSTAFYYQRLRVQTEFIVSPGLKLVTRFDALERAWGANRSTSSADTAPDSAGTVAENENIAFDLAYVHYTSALGELKVGYQIKGGWGTDFANNLKPTGEVYFGHYFAPAKLYVWAMLAKVADNSYTAINSTTYSDRDNDEYMLGVHYYGLKGFEVALLYDYLRYASGRNGGAWGPYYGYVSAGHLLEPYIRGKIGPVYIEAEVDYAWGDYVKYDNYFGYQDMKLSDLQAYIKAIATFGPVYFGGIFAYVGGDDPGSTDKYEGGYLSGGRDFNPALIMFNTDRTDWAGTISAYDSSTIGGPMRNAWFGQILVGVKPVDKLDIMASVSYATADKKPSSAWLYNEYGYEVDLTATYKITNNLSYMLGGGYLFTGKYFKGTGDSNELRDDYLILNKLTLTF